MVDVLGNGYELTKGLVMHARAGAEAGADDNVFYEHSNKSGAGILRETAFLQLTSLESNRVDVGHSLADNASQYADEDNDDDADHEPTPKATDWDVGLRTSYQEFLTGDQMLRRQHRLFLNGAADFVANPGGPFSLIAHDHFYRDERSPTLEDASTINRDDNRLSVGVRYHRTGSDHDDTLSYENWFETFEDTGYEFPSRMNHTLSLRHNWWPSNVTGFSGELSHGFYGPYGESNDLFGRPFKSKSQPTRIVAGFVRMNDALTWSIRAHVGFAHASYTVGEGYSAPLGGAEVRYDWSKPGAIGRASLLYDYDHYDSFQANFYADHLVALKFVQQLGFLIADGGPEIRWRHFGGMPMALGSPDRDDFVAAVRARLQAVVGERYAISAEYRLAHVGTDYRYAGGFNPGFTENQFTLGVWAAY